MPSLGSTAGIVAVMATALLAWQLGGSIAAVIAAAFLAFTPVFLYQAIQPMSDVPAAALWTLGLLAATSGAAVLAGLWIYFFLKRERQRELLRLKDRKSVV